MTRLFLILALLLPAPVLAEEVVAGLSRDEIEITTNFDGSEILIFGAVRRETAIPEGGPLQVIITVEGPSHPLTVRRKDHRYGIWINTDAAEVDEAPSFYAVSTTAPFTEVLSDTNDLRHRVSVNRAVRAVGMNVDEQTRFTDALIRIRASEGLYQLNEGAVMLRDETLFDTSVRLPANLVEGEYRTRIFLTRDREIVAEYDTHISVRKVGLERLIYNLAHERPLIYGILSLVIAIAAGWLASAVFRYIRT
ncbi:hypothetical protein E2K80_01760 [Rhodophyticola sp. CCM32]|uniref:TIGR02186 family protein n=1 Tax=Rhodophyticola sp. CCM32 TaxID=2916397 RepID=UPI00107F58E6|nr:TIGR02186 family protein [Rhodophyticola sp. CCM32]QBX99603.1 hypothetical protein E2K80_01760 [Rhodophyticola sp. CCM32]